MTRAMMNMFLVQLESEDIDLKEKTPVPVLLVLIGLVLEPKSQENHALSQVIHKKRQCPVLLKFKRFHLNHPRTLVPVSQTVLSVDLNLDRKDLGAQALSQVDQKFLKTNLDPNFDLNRPPRWNQMLANQRLLILTEVVDVSANQHRGKADLPTLLTNQNAEIQGLETLD